MIKAHLKGPWADAVHDFSAFAKRLERVTTQAISQEAHEWAKEIRQGIRRQSSASEAQPPWAPLAESTKAAKGSTKILIDTGTLVRSIKAEKVGRGKWHVGVKRGARTRDGKDLVNIAHVHEFGSVRQTKTGVVVEIPKRQFIAPVLRKKSKNIDKRLWEKIDEKMSKYLRHKNRV